MSEESYEMSQESYEKWYPIEPERLPPHLESLSLITNGNGSLLIVCHSVSDFEGDILLNCGYMRACQVHEEFVHPSMDYSKHQSLPVPRSTEGHKFTFSFLKVNNSIWVSTFSEIRLFALNFKPLHLQIITLGQIVDILCEDYPKARLVSKEAVEQMFTAIEAFEIL